MPGMREYNKKQETINENPKVHKKSLNWLGMKAAFRRDISAIMIRYTFIHTRKTSRKTDAGLFIFQFNVGFVGVFLLLLQQWGFSPPYASDIL